MEKSSQASAPPPPPPPAFDMESFQLEGKKPVKNPFVPIGALVTAGVLTAGLISFRYGNSTGPETDEGTCGCSRCNSRSDDRQCLLLWGSNQAL
ncbi:hypothetical protein PR202_gb22764 [Eleusine coracana subsp. coracana]|uniref:HIG1 domain-containing protein n=1 Tax=Eleusine coracana subsp. coracana TaxID=191504 RepID=A0AAV5FH40_ELECO|nr:hypothetical protein PR202_gb22764 [Eleusine coracana subsp. coracana]